MKKLLSILALALLAVLFLTLPVFRSVRNSLFTRFVETRSFASNLANNIASTASNANLFPAPLRGSLEEAHAFLDEPGVIANTNQQRIKFGSESLIENPNLDHAARLKLQDMFDKQYFEHVSPSGVGPGDLADKVSYAYVLVGENLALGNFKDSAALVDAWMNSPGHRENILNKRYTEIGVAVGEGMYQGQKTWLAVQEFGRPLAACPQPSSTLKQELDSNKSEITILQQDLDQKKKEVDSAKASGDQGRYSAAVNTYNDAVNKLNSLIDTTKQLVADYNVQVNNFNACLKQ